MDNIVVRKVELNKIDALNNLYQLYQYDFSEINSDDVNSSGLYVEDFDLDIFFSDPDKCAYFILVNDSLAGFVLMNKYPYLLPDKVNSIAEFFVMRKYRKNGIGMFAANYIFDLYPGRMILEVRRTNLKACNFWKKVVLCYNVKSSEIREENYKKVDWFIYDIVI